MSNRAKEDQRPPNDTDPSQIEVSYEALEEEIDDARRNRETGDVVDTGHTDGSTENPVLAQEQGLVYLPPSDPPVLPSDGRQNVEIAAGFATSIEESEPGVVELPAHVAGNDLDLEQTIRETLHNNSDTANLEDIHLSVRNGIVFLAGRVETLEEITIVDEMLRDLRGVRDVRNHLDVAPSPT